MPRPKRRAGMRLVAITPRLATTVGVEVLLQFLNTPVSKLSAALARWGMLRGWDNHALFRELAEQYAAHRTLLVPGSRGKDIARIQRDLDSYKVTLLTGPDEEDAARKNFRLRLLHAPLAPAYFWITLLEMEQHRIRLGRCRRCPRFFLDPKNRGKRYCSTACEDRARSKRRYEKVKRAAR